VTRGRGKRRPPPPAPRPPRAVRPKPAPVPAADPIDGLRLTVLTEIPDEEPFDG
jgi:hypothetical protein